MILVSRNESRGGATPFFALIHRKDDTGRLEDKMPRPHNKSPISSKHSWRPCCWDCAQQTKIPRADDEKHREQQRRRLLWQTLVPRISGASETLFHNCNCFYRALTHSNRATHGLQTKGNILFAELSAGANPSCHVGISPQQFGQPNVLRSPFGKTDSVRFQPKISFHFPPLSLRSMLDLRGSPTSDRRQNAFLPRKGRKDSHNH